MRNSLSLREAGPVMAVAALMCVAGAQRWNQSKPNDVAEFHAAVREAWAAAPMIVGDWVGSDISLPTAAVKMLRPNASLNRAYRNLRTGETVTVLAIHCGDSRDMEGHYPPNCYPANGQALHKAVPEDWVHGTVRGTAYEFTDARFAGSGGMFVAGAFVIHGVGTAREMTEMHRKTRSGGTRYYGASQFQIVMSSSMSDERRRELTEKFFVAYAPLLKAAESGSVETAPSKVERSGT